MDTVHDSEVKDRQSFIRFLELLHQDYIKNGSEWENNNLERFLETMSAYTNDIQGFYDNTAQNVNADTASWKVFADILRRYDVRIIPGSNSTAADKVCQKQHCS